MENKNAHYVLDTNALFNTLKYLSESNSSFQEALNKLQTADCYISELSTIEIKSVLGKYARGGMDAPKKMSSKMVKTWLKLISEVTEGKSEIFSVSIIPFDNSILEEAKKIINHAMVHNFGSLDSIIMATTSLMRTKEGYDNTILVTSDTGMLAGMGKYGIPGWDAFKHQKECSHENTL